MAEAQLTERIIIRVTPEMKEAIEQQLPNPSQFVREAINNELIRRNYYKSPYGEIGFVPKYEGNE